MELQNRDRFNSVVNGIFESLAAAFPMPIDVDAHLLGLVKGPAYKIVNHSQIPANEVEFEVYEFVTSCVEWLESADYLRASKHYSSLSKNVLLTEKGLQLLNASPISLLRGNYT